MDISTPESMHWRAPRAIDRKWFIVPTAVIALVVAAVVATALIVDREVPPPPPPPPAPTAHKLSTLEAAGVTSLLERQKAGAHRVLGKLTVGGRPIGIQLTYIPDGSTGSGTITAGGTRGETLLDQNVVYVRGDQAFWTALGVIGAPPAEPGWVNVGPEFLEGKIFYPVNAWTTVLAPNPQAILDGNAYSTPGGSSTIGATDITHYTVAGIDVDVAVADNDQTAAAAAALNNDRGPGVPLMRSPAGEWTLSTPAPPTKPHP